MNLGLRDPYDESVSPKKERGKKHPSTALILFALNSLGASRLARGRSPGSEADDCLLL